nr:hypothetical protein Iba_chr07cCG5900 [Ipomoea batatas]
MPRCASSSLELSNVVSEYPPEPHSTSINIDCRIDIELHPPRLRFPPIDLKDVCMGSTGLLTVSDFFPITKQIIIRREISGFERFLKLASTQFVKVEKPSGATNLENLAQHSFAALHVTKHRGSRDARGTSLPEEDLYLRRDI